LNELELQKFLLAEAKARKEAANKNVEPTDGKSQTLRQNIRSMSLSNLKTAGDVTSSPVVKGKASVASGYENAAGEINVDASTSKEAKRIDKGKGREKDLQFPKRTVPSLVVKNKPIGKLTSAPVSKSQSQLALLLEQDRVRANDQHGKGKKDREKSTETGSEDTPDEGLFMAPRERKKR